MNRLTIDNALASLAKVDDPFKELLQHGSMSVEIYKPQSVDLQTPHEQDELYVVISGSGQFVNGDSRAEFEKGEILFVPAGVVHRFENFTDDFSAWVIFYGPPGGEKS